VADNPNKHLLQYSQRDGDSRKYSPNRDIAYVFPQLITEAIRGLDDETLWQGGIKDYLKFRNITVEDIGKAAQTFAEGISLFTRYGYDSPREALGQAGFFDTPEAAQDAIMMRIGQVVAGAFFVGIRDVTPMGGQPPVGRDIDSLIYIAGQFAAGLLKKG
jgi:hypothetical protein